MASTFYTTSLATISTPKPAIRVASRKKPNFTPETFKLSINESKSSGASTLLPLRTMKPTIPLSHPAAASTPQNSIRIRTLNNSGDSLYYYETSSEYVYDDDFRSGLERLSRKLLFEEQHIDETMQKIAFWKHKEKEKQSKNQICAHALLVISKARVRTYQELSTRLITLYRMSILAPPLARSLRASFTVYSMQINLCRAYYMNGPGSENKYIFLVTFSTSEKVVSTEIIQGDEEDNIRCRRLRVDEPIHLSGLPLNFEIKVDIYALKINARPTKSPREFAKMAFNFFGHCRSPHGVKSIDEGSYFDDERETEFRPVGYAYLNRQKDGVISFLISENEYPLDGTMEMKIECSPLPRILTVEMEGFWELFCDNACSKMWVKMFNGVIRFYENPESTADVTVEPTYIIDMSTICNRKVEREVAVFEKNEKHQFRFYMDVISFPLGSDVCEHKRLLVSVENEKILEEWLNHMNKCLAAIRDHPV